MPPSVAPTVAPSPPRKLRVAIITENFLPKVDGVTRTLCKLLEHLRDEGHDALVLGPASSIRSSSRSPFNLLVDSPALPAPGSQIESIPLDEYAGHPIVPTHGVPLQMLGVYGDGLRLNFFRPLFIRRLIEFAPDVIHFVDPIWLGAQMMPAVEAFLPHTPRVSSYHTNLATYASLYGFPWNMLTSTMWRLERYLHGRCTLTFVPSPSTAAALVEHAFPASCLRIWARGIDTNRFTPAARSIKRRISWGAEPEPADESVVVIDLAEEETESEETQEREDMLASSWTRAGFTLAPVPAMVRRESFGSDSGYGGSPPFSAASFDAVMRGVGGTGVTAGNGPWMTTPGAEEIPMLPEAILPLPEPLPLPSSSCSTLISTPTITHSPFPLPALSPAPTSTSTSTSTPISTPTSKTVLLYVGRLAWEKNLRLLLDAYRALPPAVARACVLVFVGDGPARAELERLSVEYFGEHAVWNVDGKGTVNNADGLASCSASVDGRVDKKVVFEGHRSGSELAETFASADVSVFPSYTETFGQVVLEALASGLPVVGLKAEGVRDLVEDGKIGLLLDLDVVAASASASSPTAPSPPTHPAPAPIPPHLLLSPDSPCFPTATTAYAALLSTLILDPPLRASMARAAVHKASAFGWAEAMDAAVRGYEEAIDAAGRASVREGLVARSVLKGKAPASAPAASTPALDLDASPAPAPGPWSTKRGSRRWSLPLVWFFSRMRPEGARSKAYARSPAGGTGAGGSSPGYATAGAGMVSAGSSALANARDTLRARVSGMIGGGASGAEPRTRSVSPVFPNGIPSMAQEKDAERDRMEKGEVQIRLGLPNTRTSGAAEMWMAEDAQGRRAFLSVARRYGASSMQARLVILAFLMYSLATWSFLLVWPFPGVFASS